MSFAPAALAGAEVESSVNYIAGLQFKTGYIANPQTMVHGTAGVVHGDFDYRLADATEGIPALAMRWAWASNARFATTCRFSRNGSTATSARPT